MIIHKIKYLLKCYLKSSFSSASNTILWTLSKLKLTICKWLPVAITISCSCSSQTRTRSGEPHYVITNQCKMIIYASPAFQVTFQQDSQSLGVFPVTLFRISIASWISLRRTGFYLYVERQQIKGEKRSFRSWVWASDFL